jgi:Polyketide cyclase / dehydrase and lipid transport
MTEEKDPVKEIQLDRSRPPKAPRRISIAKRYPCERVDLDFVDTARHRFVSTVDLAITPEQLFEVLSEADSWSRWATALADVTWTSPKPYGVGTTRTVTMRGGAVNDAEFLAWERCSHMAFRLNQSTSKGLAAFVEDYQVQEIPSGCHITWTVGITPRGLTTRFGMFVSRPVMARVFQRFAGNLRRYTDDRFGVGNPNGPQR